MHMATIEASPPPNNAPFHWPAFIQMILSALAAFLLLGIAFLIATTNSIQYFARGVTTSDLAVPFMVASSLTFAGLLVLPSAWYSWKEFSRAKSKPGGGFTLRHPGCILTLAVFVFVPPALLLGNLVSQNGRLAWILMPPLNIIVTGLPALWLVYIGTRGLLSGSLRYRWGAFAYGLVFAPFISLVIELVLMVGIGVLALLYIMLNPSLSNQLNGLLLSVENAAPNAEQMFNLLVPFLLNPVILIIGFMFMSLLVPLVEETFKPIAVLFMLRHKITPAQGFVYGVLGGAGFGLFENLGNTSGAFDQWALLALARISTLLLHSFTAGLVGWALASSVQDKRYLRLVFSFLAAIFIHGLWNGMAVLSAISSLPTLTNVYIPTNLLHISSWSTFGIFILGFLILVLYIAFNIFLNQKLLKNNVLSVKIDNPKITEEGASIAQSHGDEPSVIESSSSEGNQPRMLGDPFQHSPDENEPDKRENNS